jgi:hypothetical protein
MPVPAKSFTVNWDVMTPSDIPGGWTGGNQTKFNFWLGRNKEGKIDTVTSQVNVDTTFGAGPPADNIGVRVPPSPPRFIPGTGIVIPPVFDPSFNPGDPGGQVLGATTLSVTVSCKGKYTFHVNASLLVEAYGDFVSPRGKSSIVAKIVPGNAGLGGYPSIWLDGSDPASDVQGPNRQRILRNAAFTINVDANKDDETVDLAKFSARIRALGLGGAGAQASIQLRGATQPSR